MGDHENPQVNLDEILMRMGQAQTATNEDIRNLTTALHSYLTLQADRQNRPASASNAPKPREPRPYDGDRAQGKLEDHIRDIRNWVYFYERRGFWEDESEKIQQAATYLTGRMHRMFTIQQNQILTFPDYIEWLQQTFRDSNEQARLRDEWHQTTQGDRSVHDYASDLVFLAARIQPSKLEEEIKEHFRTGLNPAVQLHLAEHPEWLSLSLDQFIQRADTADQIEQEKARLRRKTGLDKTSQMFTIRSVPRRGGRKPGEKTRKPPKNTPEWQNYCRENDACYNCGEPGHGVRACPKQLVTGRKRLTGKVPPRRQAGGFISRNRPKEVVKERSENS